MIVKILGVGSGVRRTQSTKETSARSSNDQRIGFTGDCEGGGPETLTQQEIALTAFEA